MNYLFLVFWMYCAGNIYRRENCENVRLQESHENFKAGQKHEHEEWQDTDRDQNFVTRLKHGFAEQSENYKQQVTTKTNNSIVVEVGGIGVLLQVPSRVATGVVIGNLVNFHTYLIVREDALTLYGFTEISERDFLCTLFPKPRHRF